MDLTLCFASKSWLARKFLICWIQSAFHLVFMHSSKDTISDDTFVESLLCANFSFWYFPVLLVSLLENYFLVIHRLTSLNSFISLEKGLIDLELFVHVPNRQLQVSFTQDMLDPMSLARSRYTISALYSSWFFDIYKLK